MQKLVIKIITTNFTKKAPFKVSALGDGLMVIRKLFGSAFEGEKEIVGSCNDVILEIMGEFYKQGQEEVRRSDIVTTAFNTASAARKTVDNTLGNMVNKKQ